ncbi:sodium:alanine symporter family protein [Boudabousia liubingyangii]|uniref:Sodium:alanine symporter family protein n=1 Tax=Boudabousia liubingyangii TaxID=1921764 RepID=A0A1Q5PK53_9ACTO|nr:alanine/glycine:cation symporter family protein [Boudabousia liubingyangii]OKL46605.1 sodium:alanine symporter family protein [Boudabousia liubingyangii]
MGIIDLINYWMYLYILVALLVGVGLILTVVTKGVQFMHPKLLWQSVVRSGNKDNPEAANEKIDGISSFQAFTVGLASRVGVGNISGVALALVAGGPGSLFWMWIVALVGMASSFVESTLAQIFKEKDADGTFRGGPAYYIKNGLRLPKLGAFFAILILFSVGICVVMVQSNTVADMVASSHQVPHWVTGLILALLTAPVVIGGLKSVAKVTSWLAPIMALVYVAAAIVVLVLNYREIPTVFSQIIGGAFGTNQAMAGIGGGILAAILNGTRRGVFSNEAGLGSVPNAAGTATVAHPVRQGYIQAFGVFVDTILVCSATGFLIIMATNTYQPGVDLSEQGASLTQSALAEHLGTWTGWPMEILLLVLVFSTVLGCYSYGQVNVDYLVEQAGGKADQHLVARRLFAVVVTIATFTGTVFPLPFVWSLADVALGIGAIINLVVIVVLVPWVLDALKDFYGQSKAGKDPIYHAIQRPNTRGEIPAGVWE